jgi:hypothetical protein
MFRSKASESLLDKVRIKALGSLSIKITGQGGEYGKSEAEMRFA